MSNSSNVRRIAKAVKMTVLSSLTVGMLFASVCSAADVRKNLAAGTQSFIKNYTIDIFEALVPPASDVFGNRN
ncbi:MAG: hypothetical protein ACE5E5_01945 [Phycisphaerae bacterium]